MASLLLVHWNAEEAAERAARLTRAGHEVRTLTTQRSSEEYKRFFTQRHHAVLIDLARLPSHGRELGGWLRRNKGTRHIPLVFLAGDPEKTARTQALLPDAVFTDWAHVESAIRCALRPSLLPPVVPGAMDGYSGTPLPEKLGVGPGVRVLLLGAPADFEATLGQLPPNAKCTRRYRETPLVLLFTRRAAELAKRWPTATRAVSEGGRLWICWPKAASGLQTDLNETGVRSFGMNHGWVDFKIAAVDATWSGLAFTRSRTPSPKEAA
jgi:CheY-like chemotaxis protein